VNNAFRSRPLLATLAFGIALIATVATAPALALATTTVQIVADVGGCFSGHQPSSGTMTVTWTDKNGHVKASFPATGSISTGWRPPAAACQHNVVAYGDLIHVHVTSPDDVTHDFRIKPISATFHRSTNRVHGNAPVSGALSITIGRPSLTTGSIPKMCSLNPTRTAAGDFNVDATDCVPGYDTTGGDVAVVVWNTPGGDFERSFVRAPYVEAVLGKPTVRGYLDAATSASLVLRSSGGQVRGTSKVTSSLLTGIFAGAFKNGGIGVKTIAGNLITGNWEGAHSYRVRQLVVAISPSAINGACDPNVPYGLALVRAGEIVANLDGTTNGSGATGTLSTSESGLNSGDAVVFICMNLSGDRTKLVRAVD